MDKFTNRDRERFAERQRQIDDLADILNESKHFDPDGLPQKTRLKKNKKEIDR